MQSTLAEFQETASEQPFALQNSKLLKVSLDQVTIQAKAGSMVAYQGQVAFDGSTHESLRRYFDAIGRIDAGRVDLEQDPDLPAALTSARAACTDSCA